MLEGKHISSGAAERAAGDGTMDAGGTSAVMTFNIWDQGSDDLIRLHVVVGITGGDNYKGRNFPALDELVGEGSETGIEPLAIGAAKTGQ